MTIQLTDLDRKILEKHDPSVRPRALLELEIVHALIAEAGKNEYGYHFHIEGEPRIDSAEWLSTEDLLWQLFDLRRRHSPRIRRSKS